MPRIRVLLVDDTAPLRMLVRYSLEADGRFEVVGEAADGRSGTAMAEELQPDVVLLDLSMPVMDGLAALPLIRACAPQSVVVVLSAFATGDAAAEAIARGAAAYVEKGTPLDQLAAVLVQLLGRPRRAPQGAVLDRPRFVAELRAACTAAADQIGLVAVALDRFSSVVAAVGYDTAEQVLDATRTRLRAAVADEPVAWLGGDTFAVLLRTPDRDGVEAAIALGRLLQRALAAPVTADGREVVVTASVGIAFAARPPRDGADLLRDAEAALKVATARGPQSLEVADESLRLQTRVGGEIEQGLRRALERDELRLRYQPTVSLVTGAVVGLEALLRWEHPERGLLEPAEFIDVAERSGLIVPIGIWTLQTALRQLVSWRATDPNAPAPRVAVNLSARQLADPHLASVLSAALLATGVDPQTVALEVTERAVQAGDDATVSALAALRALGVRLGVDDVGTGSCDIATLRRLPVDFLKIDRSAVAALGDSAADNAVVRAVVDLAHALGLVATAEGVETPEQAETLRAMGCDLAQGWHFAGTGPGAAAHGVRHVGAPSRRSSRDRPSTD